MKSAITTLFFIFILASLSHSQSCLPNGISFFNQEDIDNFSTNYPGCTIIEDDVEIAGNNISDLSGLSQLTEIEGDLTIIDCDSLLNLTGLESIGTIGGNLYIERNLKLKDLAGLESLTTIGNSIKIERNDSLLSLEGLTNLETIFYSLLVKRNPLLLDFSGLESLISIGSTADFGWNESLISLSGLESLASIEDYLIINYCNSLINLEGLESLTYIGENFTVENNPSLTSLSGLETLNFIGGNSSIAENDNLVGLSGMETLDTVGGYLKIDQCNSLVNLSGLNGLTSIGGDFEIINNNSLTSLGDLNSLNSVDGNVFIYRNSELTNLSGFESLTNIQGSLNIWENNILTSLFGLESLTSVNGDLVLLRNDLLASFNSMQSLVTIGGDLEIRDNDSMISIDGLGALTSIGGGFWIYQNELLANLNAFQSLTNVGSYLNITENPSLISLAGLEALSSVNGFLQIKSNSSLASLTTIENFDFNTITDLRINNNPSLASCQEPFICDYLGTNNPATIENNARRCNSKEEIVFYCEFINRVNFPSFLDINENKLLDSGEPYYSDINIEIDPTINTAFGNSANGGLVYLNDGIYMFTFDELSNPNWELTTDSSNYTLAVGNASTDTIFFGIRPLNDISLINPLVVSPPTRCNQFITFDIIAQNQGTTTVDGTLWFQRDEDISETEFIDIPDTTVNPDKFGWHFTDLYPGESVLQQIKLKIPGPPGFPLGDLLYFESWVDYQDPNGEHSSISFTYESEVQCSYDPNDKLVNPVYPDNYALMGEDLVYTIRFQNTGNAEAYDVIIRDTLDDNLDPATFKVISSSHEEVLSTSLAEGKFLTFTFHDIYLPDSTSNFEGSQGYVAYRIKTFDGLPEETIINNTAGIYFDLNDPVITNTTENVMLSTFDFDEDGFDLFVDCDDMNADINPDAEEIPNNGIDENCDGLDVPVSTNNMSEYPIEIFPNPADDKVTIILPKNIAKADLNLMDSKGITILQSEIGAQTNIDLSVYPDGVYFLKIYTEDSIWQERVVKL